MKTIRLDGTAIRDETSFHRECQRVLGFPGFYGANWNAWIDCMSYIDDPAAEMSAVHVAAGERLEIEVTDTTGLSKRCPDVLQALVECTAAVNDRLGSGPGSARVMLTFLDENPI
jgi:RNAse (barnase) inhibitor barstar